MMTDEPKEISTAISLTELKELFGPPPVLRSESVAAYYAIWSRFERRLNPRDFLEQMLIKDLTDSTWDMMRYTRHKTLTVERKFRQRLEFQAQRVKAEQQRRDARDRERKENAERPATTFERMVDLEVLIDATVEDVDEILSRIPAEFDHARALEEAIEYHEQLERSLNGAIARRNNALDQLERYREGLGQNLRRVSNAIIEAEYSVNEQPGQIESPLVPSEAETP